jgi:hypothetical protein
MRIFNYNFIYIFQPGYPPLQIYLKFTDQCACWLGAKWIWYLNLGKLLGTSGVY